MGILSKESDIQNIPANYNQTATASSSAEVASTDTAEAVSTYLDKKRGKIGTVMTSWQGLLDEGKSTKPKRKTLLGE